MVLSLLCLAFYQSYSIFFFFYEGDSVFVLFFTLIKYCFSTNHGFKVVLYLINFKCVGLHVSALELALPIYNMIDLAQ